MNKEFEKDFLPAWCEECDEQGIYFVEDTETLYWVVHQPCGYEVLSAWCEDCGMGYAFPINPSERPKRWKCSNCKKTRKVPVGLYKKSMDLHLEIDLPPDVRERLKINNQPFSLFAQVSSLVGVFTILVGMFLIHFEVIWIWKWWFVAIGAFLLAVGLIVGKIHIQKYLSKQR